MDGLAPALLEGDSAIATPRADEPGYVEALLRIVEDHGVGVVVPTIDPELPVLAASRASFQ